MTLINRKTSAWSGIFILLFVVGCRNTEKPPDQDLVRDPARLDERVAANIKLLVNYSVENNGIVNDSVTLKNLPLINRIYQARNYQPIWSKGDYWNIVGDSLYYFLPRLKEYGLFPSDYPVNLLSDTWKHIEKDSASRQDAALWTRADVLFTDTYLSIAKDLCVGRLERDSITLRRDSLFTPDYIIEHFTDAVAKGQIVKSLEELEPALTAYKDLKAGVRRFLESDTVSSVAARDSMLEDFKRIAITLDRYKLLPDTLPNAYLWVNIPAYKFSLYDADTLVLSSKIIVGAPGTRTPVLNSTITNFITYPQWTVPYSIIFKEMLPGIQKDINYLSKRNLMVVDKNDSVIDPITVDWSKLSKTRFPYLIRQREGDDNSLGVIKFNFRNPYSVYLHDTNARSLFARSNRAMSHGCVRVEKWKDLSRFLVRHDAVKYSVDTLNAWMGRQEKHIVSGFQGLPVYIRYFTVEADNNGALKFYNDIYNEDSLLSVKYFSGRSL